MNDITLAQAKMFWNTATDEQKAVVKFGMVPIEATREISGTPRDIAVALFKCAEDDGGMVA